MNKLYLELNKFKNVLQNLVIKKIKYISSLGMTQKESKIAEITKFVKNLVSFFNSLIYVGLSLILGNLVKFSLFVYYKINEMSEMLTSGYFLFIQKLKGLGILFTQSTFEIVYFFYWCLVLIILSLIISTVCYIIYNILKFLIYGLKWLNTQKKELTQYGINLIEKEPKLEEKSNLASFSKSNYMGTFERPLIEEDQPLKSKSKLKK